MVKIYPAQFLNELLQNYTPKDGVVKIEVRKLNKLIGISRDYNIDMKECYFEDIEDFIRQTIFNKHQSIISYNEIYLLNCSEVRNRIEEYTNMYSNSDFSYISKNWENV